MTAAVNTAVAASTPAAGRPGLTQTSPAAEGASLNMILKLHHERRKESAQVVEGEV